jgi:hypothetical protein
MTLDILAKLTGFFLNIWSVLEELFKKLFIFLIQHLYMMLVPGIMFLKMVYDLCRAVTNIVINLLHSLGDGFDNGSLSLPDLISFVNYFFPIDEIFVTTALLFTFFVGCQTIATIRGIKQTILF